MKLISLVFEKASLFLAAGVFFLIQVFSVSELLGGPLADEAKKIAKDAVEFDKLLLDYKDLLDMGEVKQAKNLNSKLSRSANLLTRVKDLSSKIEKLEAGSQGNEAELKEAKEKAAGAEEQLKSLQVKLDELQKQLTEKETELNDAREEAQNSQSALKNYEMKNQTAQSSLSSCQSKLQSAESRIDDCKYELTQAKSRLDACEAKTSAPNTAGVTGTSGASNKSVSSY